MLKPTINQIIQAYKKNNYKIFDGVDDSGNFKALDLNIFGIRAKNIDQTADLFDDLIGVFYKLNENNTVIQTWQATTDPGKYFLNDPMNSNGTFIMIPGQYRGAYAIGKHHTQDALVQVGMLKGYRDTNRDNIMNLDPSLIYEGSNFGVNIHHKEVDSETIGLGSAGCQVFKNTAEHQYLIGLCRQAVALWGNSFTYTLLTENEVFS